MNIKKSTLEHESYAKRDRNEEDLDKFKEHIGIAQSSEA